MGAAGLSFCNAPLRWRMVLLGEIRVALKGLGCSSEALGTVRAQVRDWYLDSFQDLRSFREIATPSDEMAFTKLLAAIKERHNHVVPTMAMGIQELKHDLGRRTGSMHDLPDIHQFLDRFFMSRIGIRMLIGAQCGHPPEKSMADTIVYGIRDVRALGTL